MIVTTDHVETPLAVHDDDDSKFKIKLLTVQEAARCLHEIK